MDNNTLLIDVEEEKYCVRNIDTGEVYDIRKM